MSPGCGGALAALCPGRAGRSEPANDVEIIELPCVLAMSTPARTPDSVVMVSEDHGVYTMECLQYYERDGVLKLTITQPLNRALATFAALLAADTQLETREYAS